MIRIFKNLTKIDALFIFASAALVVVQVWLDLKMPDYTQALTVSVSDGSVEWADVWGNGGRMLLCAVASMAASIVCGYFAARLAANFARTVRGRLFDRITEFSSEEINRFSTPSLITRTTNDVVQMQMLLAMGLQVMIKAPVLAIWAIGKISSINDEWTYATLITVVVMVCTIGTLVALCYPRFKKIQRLTDDLNDATRENLSGVRVVRAFNAEAYQEQKFAVVNESITRNQLFTSRTMGLMMPVMSVCMSGLTLAIYWIGAYLISAAAIPERAVLMGNMTAFTQYALQVVMAFMMLIMIFVVMPRTMVSAKRIAEVLDTVPGIRYPARGGSVPRRGEVEFRNVSFSYADDAEPCIRNISFTARAGETLAIIGATGTGKSTLVNLIPRFYEPTAGEILIDGVDIRDYPEEELERVVSIAPQKAVLFRGDVAGNVSYGEESGDEDAVRDALALAQADFALETPDGIHASVAQGGTNFSGGQKQRLSIARAVYKKSPVVIFDDTFSALDFRTDMLVRKAIREQMAGSTVIIVAQRIGTIKNADQIIVLDEGEIAGIGTHAQLLASCPVYREIALSQLSEEELSCRE